MREYAITWLRKSGKSRFFIVAVIGFLSVFGPQTESIAAWEPSKPVEFIIAGGKGGVADEISRLMQSIIVKYKLSPVRFIPINKPGGSGAEALMYLKEHTGDDHVIMVTLNEFYTTPLRIPSLDVNISTYTPIGRMAEDTFLLWVNADAPIMNVGDFVKAAKAKGDGWVMAGNGKYQEDQILTSFLNKAYGLKMKYVSYKGGGRVAKALTAKNADSAIGRPSAQLGFYEAGKTRPLASFTAERLPQFKDAPTFRELGKDLVYFMQRSVVGAPGMGAEAAAYFRGVFSQVYATNEWQEYMNKHGLEGAYLSGPLLKQYWIRERNINKEILKRIGEID